MEKVDEKKEMAGWSIAVERLRKLAVWFLQEVLYRMYGKKL